jgi:glyoxylate reductase
VARVFATCDIGAEALELVRRAGHDLEVWAEPTAPPHSVIVEKVASGIAGLITTLRDPIDRTVLEAGEGRLRVVAQDAVGTDNVDLDAATELGIVVTHAPEVLTHATAEFALFLLGSAARRIVPSEALVRSGRWAGWHPSLPFLGDEVTGASVAVVGCGRIGRAFAAKCTGLDVDLLLVSRRADRTWLEGLRSVQRARVEAGLARRAASAEHVGLDEALRRADFVSLHVPLVASEPDATVGMIGEAELALMKPTAWLVNTARGAVVDEEALASALRAGRPAGAALDVFAVEPLPAASPLLAEDLRDRVRLCHHLGSGTTRTRLSPDPDRGMAGRTVAGLLAALGDPPAHRWVVNPPGG